MASLEAGDVLLVAKLDRLARCTRDLLNTLDAVVKPGAGFRSLGDPWSDTTTPRGKLMITGGLAEFERHLILHRRGQATRKAFGSAASSPNINSKRSSRGAKRARLSQRSAGATTSQRSRGWRTQSPGSMCEWSCGGGRRPTRARPSSDRTHPWR